MRQRKDRGRPLRDAAQHAQQSGADNPDQDCAVDLARHQEQGQHDSEAGGLHFFVGKTSQTDERGCIGHHQLGIPQPHESDKEANAGGGRMLQAIGHAVDDLLAHPRDCENQEKNAGKEDHAQRRAPGNMHVQTDGIGKVGVERHTRRSAMG